MNSGGSFPPLRRRDFLAGLAGAALVPRRALAEPRTSPLRALLDHAAAAGEPVQMLAALREFDTARLGRDDAAVYRMVVRGVEREVALRRTFPFGKADGSSPYVLSQRHGLYLDAKAKPNADLARRIDEETERLRAEAARGIVPPAFILDAVLESERGTAARVGPEVGAALARRAEALERLRKTASHVPGVWRLPGGTEYYALRLRCTTGTDMAPAELDRQVRAETRALLARADRLLNGLGLRGGSVGARLRALKARPEHLYTNDEQGRARAVADMNAALARLRPHLATWFNPPFEGASSIRRMTETDERAARRGYRDSPSPAGPGAYYPDLSAVADRADWTLTTVAYHESIPGHLLQLRRQALADPHPLQVRYAAGYSEGWAIYAESLADRIGLLSPLQQLGFIQSLLFRLARVTADIGIHLHRWDRPRAVRYLEETVGFELFFPFAVEVDRYAAEPAGFAGDALAALALRHRAPAAPAAARAFHDQVLNRGPLSVEALARLV